MPDQKLLRQSSLILRLFTTALSVLGNLSTTIMPLLFIPIFHKYLTSEEFGAWNTALALGGIAVLLDLGVKSELLSRVSRSIDQKDSSASRLDITSACVAISISVLIGIAIILAIVLVFHSLEFSSSTILIAVIVGSVVTMIGQVTSSVFLAQGLVVRNAVLQVLGVCFAGLFCYLLIHSSFSFWFIALVYSATPGVVLIVAMSYEFAKKEFLRPSRNLISIHSIRELIYKSFGYFKLTVLMVVAYNSDVILVASKFGFLSSEIFSIPARIGSLFAVIIVGINMPSWSIMATQLSQGNRSEWNKVLFYNSFLGLTAVTIVGALASFFANEIVLMWIGTSLPQQVPLISAFTSQNIFVALFAPFIIRLSAMGNLKGLTWAWAAYIAISLPLKLKFATQENLALIPIISASCYVLVMLPALFLKRPKFFKTTRR